MTDKVVNRVRAVDGILRKRQQLDRSACLRNRKIFAAQISVDDAKDRKHHRKIWLLSNDLRDFAARLKKFGMRETNFAARLSQRRLGTRSEGNARNPPPCPRAGMTAIAFSIIFTSRSQHPSRNQYSANCGATCGSAVIIASIVSRKGRVSPSRWYATEACKIRVAACCGHDGKRAVQRLRHFAKTPLQLKRQRYFLLNIDIARIQIQRAKKFVCRFVPMSLASVNVTLQGNNIRVIRQPFLGER